MRYRIFDVDLTDPAEDLALSPEERGIAVLVRRAGVPIGFWMEETRGARVVPASALTQRIAREVKVAKAASEHREPTVPRATSAILTIAICTKDRPEGVERLLGSLRQIVTRPPPPIARVEVLVVDNAPSDERTRELVRHWPDVRYVREPPPGLNFGRNRAVREARGELIAFLDDDVVADAHWLEGLADAWSANSDAAAFTGQVLPLELETEAQILFEQRGGFRRGFDRIRYGQVLRGNPVYPAAAGIFGTGANMAFKVDVLRSLGGFDEALDTGAPVPGGGDLDIFYRVIRAGYVLVYEPRYLVFHQHRRDRAALIRQYQRSWGLGFMCFIAKCLATDRERRPRLLLQIAWWVFHHVSLVVLHSGRKMLGVRHVPPSIFAGELWYGAIGLAGGYRRSQRRVRELKERYRPTGV